MTATAKRFSAGFAVTAVAGAFLNFLPYLLTRGAYNGDDFEVVGFPFTFRRFGGIAGIYEFRVLALLVDSALALLVAFGVGYAFTRLCRREGTSDVIPCRRTFGERRTSVLKLFKKPRYRLVLEFHGDDPENFERVIALETKLEQELESGEVDGNDVGQGVLNIFIITKEPKRCFEEAMRIISGAEPAPRAAAFRDLEEEVYIRLWPEGDATPFELK